jgi:transposase
MAKINSIQTLARRGWSQRRIARELGIDRGTVRHHLAECPPDSKPAKVTTGEIGGEEANPAKVTTGSEHAKPAKVTAGAQSRCRGCEGLIEDKLKLGLHAQRIWQDLVSEQQFEGSYESVKRFVRKLRERDPARVWRMEGEPGEEAQVDFGLGAPLREPTGRTVRTWVFRIILSHSRKGYSEAVRRQDTETFIRCLENAFRAFGGVPASLNVDNLKAAVLKADWYDPELNPKLAAFCAHYGTVLAPSRPYRPQDKGKVEAGVKYVRYNALKGRVFESLAAENAFLRQWEEQVADQRIHGTTRQQVRQRFLEVEKAALRPLAGDLFPAYQEAQRRVHRDSYVEVGKAYYEVPEQYIHRVVWARWDSREVRLHSLEGHLIITHTRLEPGQFSRHLGCGGRAQSVELSLGYWEARARCLGPHCGQWAGASSATGRAPRCA